MSFWLIEHGQVQTDAAGAALVVPSAGLPDLSRALSRNHLREWVSHLLPETPPEVVDERTDYYWNLFSSVQPDDYVIVVQSQETVALGEVIGAYYYEAGSAGGRNIWPMRWIATEIPLEAVLFLRPLLGGRGLREIRAEEARIGLRRYLPSWKMKWYLVFRWVSMVLLLAELVYFWPKK